jgi:hypothetical protein
MQELLPRATKGELWIADRNFCCAPILLGFNERGAYFLVRERAISPNPKAQGKRRSTGRVETGQVYEQIVSIKDENEVSHRFRRIEIHLDTPTEDGDTVIRLLTNAPASTLSAKKVCGTIQAQMMDRGNVPEIGERPRERDQDPRATTRGPLCVWSIGACV